ncbi:MAG: ThuA domain-containing protein [Bacteroidota bacterium]
MKKVTFPIILFLFVISLNAQSFQPIPIDSAWLAKIESIAPSSPRIKAEKRKVLVFSQHTGFNHWTIPHNNEMLKIMAKKSGAFEVTIAKDLDSFDKKNLKKYDAVIFNNCNPTGPDRNLFADLMDQYSSLDPNTIAELAPQYEQNMLDYVAKGGGLMIMHGAITVQNNSKEFSKMTGGSFDYHPRQQEIHLKEVDPNHPMVQAFKGQGFTHVDEPYFFNNAYSDYNFRPLLYFNVSDIEGVRKEAIDDINYVAWIKRYGKGRVFYSSPSHNAQSMNKELLQFFMDGIQYVSGDLPCDDSPIGK